MIGQSYTWGSNLSFHPHVHCIVPAGGVTLKNKWKQAKGKGKFLFPVKALSKVFKGNYIHRLDKFFLKNGMELGTFKNVLHKTPWVVYAKPPSNGKAGLIKYLARYTHKIAISNHRIISYDHQKVVFKYTDYKHQNSPKVMQLTPWEFVRRFSMHILPHRFTRIRHYGILSAQWKIRLFNKVAGLSQCWMEFWTQRSLDISKCPACKKGTLIPILQIPAVRGPPQIFTNRHTTIQI